MYGLWLDDIRIPPPTLQNALIARNSNEAIDFVKNYGFPNFMWLDHDLGGDDTTMVFLKAIAPLLIAGKITIPTNFNYELITANPVGKANIESYLMQLIKVFG